MMIGADFTKDSVVNDLKGDVRSLQQRIEQLQSEHEKVWPERLDSFRLHLCQTLAASQADVASSALELQDKNSTIQVLQQRIAEGEDQVCTIRSTVMCLICHVCTESTQGAGAADCITEEAVPGAHSPPVGREGVLKYNSYPPSSRVCVW